MQDVKLTERQIREKAFYEEYSKKVEVTEISINFDPVSGNENRPWNSYWAIYQLAMSYFKKGSVLLDFGCGPGENAIRYAKIGYDVVGFDISESNVKIATDLAKKYESTAKFNVSLAENLSYSNESFELISGIDILHHVDMRKSLNECYRVLKNDGVAIFREPVEVPLLDTIRNLGFIRYLIPNKASLDAHITEDERKLNESDEVIMQEIFPIVEKHYFLLFARLDKFFRKGSDPRSSYLEKIDFYLIKIFPFLKKFCGAIVYVLRKNDHRINK